MEQQPTKVVLPPKYYLKYFEDFLRSTERLYASLLSAVEWAYLHEFQKLSEDAKCLYIRMATRRGRYFKLSTLSYEEFAAPTPQLAAELARGNWAHPASAEVIDPELLDLFTKDEWLHALQARDPKSTALKKLSKENVVKEACLLYPPTETLAELLARQPVLQRQRDDVLDFFKFLYFGNISGDFSGFILRDIGVYRFEERAEEMLVPRFSSRQSIDEAYSLRRAYEDFKNSSDIPLELLRRFEAWQSSHGERLKLMGNEAQRIFERWALRLATMLEKSGHKTEALWVYRLSAHPPSRQRQARLLKEFGRLSEAYELCRRVVDDPEADTADVDFARDFLERRDQRRHIKSTTTRLKEAEVLVLAAGDSPEMNVIAHYEKQGFRARFTENVLWNSLFGVCLWDLIHSAESHYHFPLQINPSQLYRREFFRDHAAALESKLQELARAERFHAQVEKIVGEKFGTVNFFVTWYPELGEELRLVYELVGWEKLSQVLRELAQNPYERGKGFPDLFIWKAREYCFVEVKSPRDKLSSYQLRWLKFFEQIGLCARLLKLKNPS